MALSNLVLNAWRTNFHAKSPGEVLSFLRSRGLATLHNFMPWHALPQQHQHSQPPSRLSDSRTTIGLPALSSVSIEKELNIHLKSEEAMNVSSVRIERISFTSDGEEVEQLAVWCSLNNLELNTIKTVEMTVKIRKNTPALPPPHHPEQHGGCCGVLQVPISQDPKWVTHVDSVVKKAFTS